MEVFQKIPSVKNWGELIRSVSGAVIFPDSTDKEALETIWNGMNARKPACIVRCVDVTDIVAAFTFANRHHLLVAVKGGKNNAAGLSICDGGIFIDLSNYKW